MTDIEVIQLKKFFTYTYIVCSRNSGDAVIVDPVWDSFDIEKKLKNLNLKAVLLTHHHFDHVNLADKMASKYRIPVYMSKREIDYYSFDCLNLHELEHKQVLDFEDFSILPFLTPGHTKGGMCFMADDFLFTGDTVFVEGCGMCDIEGGDAYEMYESLQFLRENIDVKTRIYPGHSYGKAPGQTFFDVLQSNIYFSIEEKEKFVSFRMRKNQKNLFNFK